MTFLFSKNKVSIIILLLLFSCSNNESPVKKNNEVFLGKYSMQISRAKQKHLKKAKDADINYNKKTMEDLIDSNYYKPKNSRKYAIDYVLSNESRHEKEEKNDPEYIKDNLSIYFRNRTLKDEYDYLGYELSDNNEKLRFLVENKNDYSEARTNFKAIEPTKERLYGELKLRNNNANFSSFVGADVILKNFDYLYVMDTVKKEFELKNKSSKSGEEADSDKKISNTRKVIDSLKDKFKELLKK